MVRLTILGEVEVTGPEGVIHVGGPVQRRLLAVLAVHANTVLSAERLVDAVWGEDQTEGVRSGLKAYIGRLRSALADGGADGLIVTRSPGYALEIAPDAIDAARFESLVDRARAELGTGEPAQALTLLDEALSLWRGPAFDGYQHEPWAQTEVHRLEELRISAQELRISAKLDAGRATELLPEVEALIAAHPFRDRLRGQRMLALYRSGRQVDALRSFQEYRELLADEVGVEPGVELVELDRRITVSDETLLDAGSPVRSVGDYELGERIGEGAFSVVFRGVQRSLGRDVAVKQIRSELANRPEFIRRFEAEAQMVAGLEHPHIVPLHDYWREPGAAYLVMRWLRGGTLEERIAERRLDLAETAQLATQIGAALATAHAEGVVHRDVKSPNIFLDPNDNFYLGDFGIAVDTQTEHDPESLLSAGSPAYASPEQLRREPAGPASDVHSLAIVLYEALTGQLPFPHERSHAELLQRQLHDPIPAARDLRPDLPAGVDDVLQRATAKNPGDRFPGVAELVESFVEAIDETAPATPGAGRLGSLTLVGGGTNPYKGLSAFQESDADDFFGRDRLVDRLVARLGVDGPTGRLVAAVGPSGSGKSSVVRAGLIPRIRRGALPGSENWFITTMVPGSDPFEELEAALSRVSVAPVHALVERMREDVRGISRATKAVLPDETSELVIVIDQFEELFTLVPDDDVRQAFIERIAAAISDAKSRVRIVVTIRADFWDRPLRHPELARILETSAVTVTPLAADELERAIVDPARRMGVEFEPGLAPVIAADVQDQPGALPLLQYALTELFDRQVSGLLRLEDYRDLGGVAGALARRAEELYEAADTTDRAAIKALFSRLVTPGEGVEDTRRRVLRSELSSTPDEVIDRYGAARLLSFDHELGTRAPTVEVAHEALIREWPRLRAWLDDDRETLRAHRQLTAASDAWLASGCDDGDLYRGGRLETAESLLTGDTVLLNESERSFLASSIDRRAAEIEAERRRVQRLRRLATTTAIIAVIALVAGAVALAQWNRADDKAAEAEDNAQLAEDKAAEALANEQLAEDRALEADLERLLALARTADPIDPTIGILLAVEAHRLSPSVATLDALHRALTARRGFMGTLPSGGIGGDITAVDDGSRLVIHTSDSIQLWNVEDRAIVHRWPAELPDGSMSAIDIRSTASADGRVVAATTRTQTRAFDAATGATVLTLDHADEAPAVAVAASPDGSAVAVGLASGVVEIWDLSTGRLQHRLDGLPGDVVWELEWDPSGSALGIISAARVSMWQPGSDDVAWQIGGEFLDLLFSSSGERLVLSSATVSEGFSRAGQLLVVDPTTGNNLREPIDQPTSVGRVSAIDWWDRDETLVAGLGGTATIRVLDLASAEIVQTLSPEAETVGSGGGNDTGLAVLPGLGLVATAGAGGVELRDIDDTGPLARLAHLPPSLAASPDRWLVPAFSADGRTFVASTLFDDVDPFVYDGLDVQLLPAPVAATLPEEPDLVFAAGEFTAHVTGAGTEIRAGLDGQPVGPTLDTLPFGILSLGALSPTGDRFVQAQGPVVTLYDTASGEVVARLEDELPTPPEIGEADFWVAAFPVDGRTFVVWSAAGRASALVDATSGAVIWTSNEMGRAYALDGEELLGSSDDAGGITLHDPRTREVVAEPLIGHTALATQLWPNPGNGNLAVSAGRDGTSRVWDLETGQQLGRELRTELFSNRGWSPDGTLLANPGSDGFELWNYDTDTWVDIACQVAGRNLTSDEWSRLGPRSLDHRATCPQFPLVSSG